MGKFWTHRETSTDVLVILWGLTTRSDYTNRTPVLGRLENRTSVLVLVVLTYWPCSQTTRSDTLHSHVSRLN